VVADEEHVTFSEFLVDILNQLFDSDILLDDAIDDQPDDEAEQIGAMGLVHLVDQLIELGHALLHEETSADEESVVVESADAVDQQPEEADMPLPEEPDMPHVVVVEQVPVSSHVAGYRSVKAYARVKRSAKVRVTRTQGESSSVEEFAVDPEDFELEPEEGAEGAEGAVDGQDGAASVEDQVNDLVDHVLAHSQ
jgi:hypothetical protein